MGMRIHIGVDTESNVRGLAQSGATLGNDVKLGFRFYVEACNVGLKCQIDFPIGLTHTCEYYRRGGESVLHGYVYLTAAYAVNAQTILLDELEQQRIGVGLDGVVYVPVNVLGGAFLY